MTDLLYRLQRFSDNGESSLGLQLQLPGPKLQCFTLEDEAREIKKAGDTRIPAGVYELRLRQELTPLTQKYRARFPTWFVWHIEIVNVGGFTSVYVHIGNDDDDTDGCILLGNVANNNQGATGFISASEQAYRAWYLKTFAHLNAGGRAYIDIRDESALAAA